MDPATNCHRRPGETALAPPNCEALLPGQIQILVCESCHCVVSPRFPDLLNSLSLSCKPHFSVYYISELPYFSHFRHFSPRFPDLLNPVWIQKTVF